MIEKPRTARLGLLVMAIFLIIYHAVGQDIEQIAKQKPFTIHGDIGLNLIGYGVNGVAPRAQPFSWVLSANATASVYGIELPFSFTLSDKQKSYSQPFNQFGLSPHYKWITLHLGYRNVNFSNYTLAGYTFLGAGVELNPGILRFGFIYGRFDRKTTESPVYETDSLPRFARRGFAVKLGLGTEKNFFDVNFLRIRDDSTTLLQSDTSAIRTPEQNVVLGINSRFTIVQKLTFELEAAVSLYTNNMGAQPFADLENNHFLSGFLLINQSSEYYTAIRSFLQYKEKNWSLKLEYKRIDPDYRSMGAYFFNNDLQNITLRPSLALFKRKLMVSGSIGLQQDNLRNTKRATSLRTIGNLNLSYNPLPLFGVDASYSNYSTSQKAGRIPLVDSTTVIQANQNFSVTPRLMITRTTSNHIVMLVYNLMNFNDKNKLTSGFTSFTSHTAQLNYILGLIPARTSLTFGITYLVLNSVLARNSGYGGSFSASKSFLKSSKLNIAWNNSLLRTDYQQVKGWVFTSNITSRYKVTRHHSLRLNFYFTGNYYPTGSANPSFNEFKGDLSYVYSF